MARGLSATGTPARTLQKARQGCFSGDPTAKNVTRLLRRSVRFLSVRASAERTAQAEEAQF